VRKSSLFIFVFLATTPLLAQSTQNKSMNCGDDDPPLTTHDYASAPGDVLQPHHLEVKRPFAINGKMEVQICNANLRVRTTRDAREARLTADFENQPGSHPMTDYIHTLRIQPDSGAIRLRFPKGAHAIVTLTLPMGPDSNNEFNLGRGDLDFNAIGSAGRREINVGMGHMQLVLHDDRNYSKMEVNVGMGSLHDHRPGGHDGHFVVSKDYAGTGAGSLEINVGMGSLDIRNE
jgi:hypothetical protein